MIDLLAQYLFFMFLLFCISKRSLISCMEDGNIENKSIRDALEAQCWIDEINLSVKLPLNRWLERINK